jgi:putative transferase (TIGR04331 family)
MFLAVTADQRFWNTEERFLFLGEWCRLYKEKSTWLRIDGETLPYHWDDREKFRQDYIYVDAVYEKYLSQLSRELDRLHGVSHSTRYWRIIIGPWLYLFIGIFYDRYSSIQQAVNSGKATLAWLPPLEYARHVPTDLPDFFQRCIGDDFNHYLYGRIIEASGKIPYETKEFEILAQDKPSSSSLSYMGSGKRVAKKVIETVSKWIPSQLNKVVFVTSFLNSKDLLRLQLSLGQLPYLCAPVVKAENISVDQEMRKKLELSDKSTLFETVLRDILPQQVPKAYVEGYRDMNRKAMASFPRAPRVIYATSACWGNDGFNFWTAAQTEQGAKLVSSQHGGCYGSAAWSTTEAHETRVCDRYFSWGWEKADQPNIVPFPSGQLAGLKSKISSDPKGSILWLGITIPRYTCQLVSVPVGRQLLDYFEEQERFAQSVLPEVHKLLIRRPFPKDYDWGEGLRWADMDPDLKICRGEKTMYQQLNESRLCIGTYHSTTDLETLAKNYPTITYFNPDLNEFRESAQPYFDDLRRVGIYHETPESAAAKVNEIYKDPLLWWRSADVQDVRKKFCHRFARISPNWVQEWKEEFQKIIKE